MLPQFNYVRAQSLEEAQQQLSTDGARVCAGGSDLLGCLRDDVFDCSKVVSISSLNQLRGIARTRDGGIRIGSLTPIAEVAASATVQETHAGLSQAASEVASPQLRNQGTIGGNICQKPRCWYYRGEFHCLRKGGTTCYALAGENQYHCILGGYRCYIVHPSDTAPALLALNATVHIAAPSGSRTVPLDEFHVHPRDDPQRETVLQGNEIVTEITLPAPPPGLRSSYRKVRARGSWDFALAGVALALAFNGDQVVSGRIVLSGAAPVPWRSREAENAVIGRRIDAATAREAAAAAMEDATALKRNAYKIPLFKGLVEQQLLAIAGA
ncbi:MAG: xanthine dehydrogenase family protein subunit M [Gemmatimonadota bacterium]|nr:MAG: xanthine dehydrogenase family protein subunit M [Gemmatimonadota bacterium]